MVVYHSFISCDKLDLYPEDSLSPTTYFKNENELQLYSNQFYYNILPTAADIYKDNADVLIVSPLDDEVTGQRIIPSTGGGWNWEALRSLNFLLENSHNCEDQDVRNKYDAITRFSGLIFTLRKYSDLEMSPGMIKYWIHLMLNCCINPGIPESL